MILVNYCELCIQRPPIGFPRHLGGGDVLDVWVFIVGTNYKTLGL